MKALSTGDMAQSFMLRRQNVQLKQTMNTLAQELASGRVQDTAKHLGGDYSFLAGFERSLAVLDQHNSSVDEAALFASSGQAALQRISDVTNGLSATLVAVTPSTVGPILTNASSDARNQLSSIVSALNTDVAGRSLFAGVDTNVAPMASADTLISELRTAVAGAPDTASRIAAADAWFASGGPFDTLAYGGSTTSLAATTLPGGETIDTGVRADEQAFRDILKNVALAAVADDPALGLTQQDQAALLQQSASGLLSSQDGLITLQARVGSAEERIENASTAIASERTSTEYAKGALLDVDPYEAATRLEDVQFQLESLYSITVRMSRLNLTRFL